MVVTVIGAGTIGTAVAKSLLKSGHEEISATRRHIERAKELEESGVRVTRSNRKAAKEARIVILCVKPKDIQGVLEEIKDEIKGKLVVSFAAGVHLSFLKAIAPEAKFVRAMPNIAVLVQESFTAYCAGSDLTSNERVEAEQLLHILGRVVQIDEKHMDAVTALSGCSPAYLSVIMGAMVQGGIEAGLPKDLALAAAAHTMAGTGKLALEAAKEPSEIIGMVATPGGVTEDGLQELEKYFVTEAIVSAVKAGASKSKRISQSFS